MCLVVVFPEVENLAVGLKVVEDVVILMTLEPSLVPLELQCAIVREEGRLVGLGQER